MFYIEKEKEEKEFNLILFKKKWKEMKVSDNRKTQKYGSENILLSD